jgi:hypothetical protein
LKKPFGASPASQLPTVAIGPTWHIHPTSPTATISAPATPTTVFQLIKYIIPLSAQRFKLIFNTVQKFTLASIIHTCYNKDCSNFKS